MAAKIGEYKGQAMFYDAEKREFSATVGSSELSASTQETLQDKISKALKALGLFPTDVISIYRSRFGHITSYDPDSRRGWFVGTDGIRDKFYGASQFYIDNPHNRIVMQTIQANNAKIEAIQKENLALEQGLTESFPDYFKAREAASEAPA